jgi:hypothetical protein
MQGSSAGVIALPKVLGFVAVLFVGWIVSSLLAKGVAALFRAVRFNQLARLSGVIVTISKWLVRLITLLLAFAVIGVPAIILVNALLFGVIGALALAFGLSFGLAGRERAAQLLEQWFPKPREIRPAVEHPGEASILEVRSGISRADETFDEEDLPEHRSGYDRRRISRSGSDRRLERDGTMG